jgi:ubiquinone/menaquinone biosynthesis C-methylase UbiE
MNEDMFSKNSAEISSAIALADKKGYQEFLAWFNKSDDVNRSFIRGAWDFSFYFINHDVSKLIKNPEKKICLEIGFGGGRLLHSSRNYFNYSYGVDIHPFADMVKQKLLERCPHDDFSLIRLTEPVIPLQEGSVDYIYSFIVIQHFYSVAILKSYLDEAARILNKEGVVNLFFADMKKYPDKRSKSYIKSMIKGYMELEYPPDEKTAYNTLWISRSWMEKALSERGFQIDSWQDSYKDVPDGYPGRHGTQSGVLAIKIS